MDNSGQGFEFVEAFYEWDSIFFVNHYGLNQEEIESNNQERYIIWSVFGESNNNYWNTYFLFGEKNGFVNNFSIIKTNKWTKEEKNAILKEMYLGNNRNE